MNSQDLTPRQCEILKAKLRPMQQYLNRLHARMIKRGFVHGDPLLVRVGAAPTAVRDLAMELHYVSCRHGVGRQAREDQNSNGAERSEAAGDISPSTRRCSLAWQVLTCFRE
jgi:hypothetical protein